MNKIHEIERIQNLKRIHFRYYKINRSKITLCFFLIKWYLSSNWNKWYSFFYHRRNLDLNIKSCLDYFFLSLAGFILRFRYFLRSASMDFQYKDNDLINLTRALTTCSYLFLDVNIHRLRLIRIFLLSGITRVVWETRTKSLVY